MSQSFLWPVLETQPWQCQTRNHLNNQLKWDMSYVTDAYNSTMMMDGWRDYHRLLTVCWEQLLESLLLDQIETRKTVTWIVCWDQWQESLPLDTKLRQGKKHTRITVTWTVDQQTACDRNPNQDEIEKEIESKENVLQVDCSCNPRAMLLKGVKVSLCPSSKLKNYP